MSFPVFPAYKDSGVAWLGLIPTHWNVSQSRRLFRQRKERLRAGDIQLTASQKYGVISQSRFMEMEGQKVVQVFLGQDILKHVEAGDFVISMRSFQGGIELAQETGCISSAYVILQPGPAVDQGYFSYLLKSDPYIQALQSTSNLVRDGQALRFENFALVDLPLVPLSEQAAIAALLDRETTKIDALVEEQRQLIALLKEKRQAVISHAITKGLDPTAPMKESGVEWLGEVPAHWEITRIKHLSSHVVDCLHTTPTYDGDVEFPAVRTADLERGKLLLGQVRLVSREVYEDRIQRLAPVAGDILYSREGERFGMAALVPRGVDLCLGQRMMMFRIKPVAASGYVMWALNSEAIFQQVMAKVAGATSPHVNISDVINFHVPSPPLSEQNEIASMLDGETDRLDALVAEAVAAITLLQERRSALISAAVTGKIDVRGLVPVHAEAA